MEFRYPLDIEMITSKRHVEVGDTIDVKIRVKLMKDHENFDAKYKFVLINQNNKYAYTMIEWKTPPEQMEKNMTSFEEKFQNNHKWIIITSDNDTIIDYNNEIINYSFSFKINNIHNSQYIRYPITFFKFNQTEDYGGFTNYINSYSRSKAQHDYDTYYFDLKIKNPTFNSLDDRTPLNISREAPIDFEIIETPKINEKYQSEDDKTK